MLCPTWIGRVRQRSGLTGPRRSGTQQRRDAWDGLRGCTKQRLLSRLVYALVNVVVIADALGELPAFVDGVSGVWGKRFFVLVCVVYAEVKLS